MSNPVHSDDTDTVRRPVRAHDGKSAEAVARAVISGLYEGRFTPGQRLVEPDMISTFQVSRSTVREALTKLAS